MVTTHYHWDADDNVFEELDDQKQVTCTYTHAPGKYGELLSENRGGTTRHYHHDAQGSTTELTDDSGAVTDTFTYSAFGEQLSRTGTTETPYRWNGAWGYQYNENLDSYYVRARVYEPSIARWISVDPLGFVDGLNLYLAYYVPNRPDPAGTGPECINAARDSYYTCHASVVVGISPDLVSPPPTELDCINRYVDDLITCVPPSSVPLLTSTAPECDLYRCHEEYANTSAACFCRCAGNSPWSTFVRGCLRMLYDQEVPPNHAHDTCYAIADSQNFPGGRPVTTLITCAAWCFDYTFFDISVGGGPSNSYVPPTW